MKPVRNLAFVCLGLGFLWGGGQDVSAQVGKVTSAPAVKSAEGSWLVLYAVPEEMKTIELEVSYCFWDPKVDGDVPSRKTLLKGKITLPHWQKEISIEVGANAKHSSCWIQDVIFNPTMRDARPVISGKGFLLEPSFTRAAIPKPNYDGVYVLAQQPTDPKHPAAMGDTQNVSAWIELGITAEP